jgi:hypothetical protein
MTTAPHYCAEMAAALNDPDLPVVYSAKFREYGVRILDGGSAVQMIRYCPWCGTRLPISLRDQWFDRLEEMGVDPLDESAIPDSFNDERWYSSDPDR